MTAGARWQVNTERVKEHSRFGYGLETLHETLKHLQGRGDETCSYMIGDSGFVAINLKTYVRAS